MFIEKLSGITTWPNRKTKKQSKHFQRQTDNPPLFRRQSNGQNFWIYSRKEGLEWIGL
jgi:hypothetical protein